MNVVFMGTPDFAVPTLNSLHDAKYNINLVITQKDKPKGRGKKLQYTPVKARALDLGLEVFQPENINDAKSINKLKEISPDFIIVTAFGQILKKEVLDIPKYGCINVHASLLPKYRGAAPINWAIINGETETGITIMEMEEGLDTGDMLSKKSIPIELEDDCSSLHDKLAILGGELLIETMDKILKGTCTKTPQDHDKSSYAPMIYKETGRIDWGKTGEEINNLIRGVKPWPGAFTRYNGETLKVHRIKVIPKYKDGKIGEIVKVSNEGIYVNVQDGTIIIEELQFPNKRRMTVKQYLAGNHIEPNTILI